MSTPTEAKFSLTYYTGFLSVLFAAFLWGTAGTAASFAKGISPLVIATISVGFGGLIHTFLSLKAIKKDYRKLFDYKTKVLIAVIVSILCPFAFLFLGLISWCFYWYCYFNWLRPFVLSYA